MQVPYLDLVTQYQSIKNEIDSAIQEVINRGAFAPGPAVSEFEAAFAAYCGSRHCVGVNNGTNALLLALKAAGIGAGDEVITTAHTFVATVEAIVHAGARPVLVDVEPEARTIDARLIPPAVSQQTRAILPVHLYGRPAPMDDITPIAGQRGLVIIEDAAQAHGARYREQAVGSLGAAAAFSFYPTKNLGAFGEAGAVTTQSSGLAERIRMLRDHGSLHKHTHELVGYNARMAGLQGAVLNAKLRHLDQWNEARRRIAGWYGELLDGLPIKTPPPDGDGRQVYHLYVIETERRDQLRAHLQRRGVSTLIHYPVPVHLQPAYSFLGYSAGAFPVTEGLVSRILSLPIYPELSRLQVEYVCDQIRGFYRGRA